MSSEIALFPGAPPELQEALAIDIGLIATMGLGPGNGVSVLQPVTRVPAALIPDFIRERVPPVDGPVYYSAEFLARSAGVGSLRRVTVNRLHLPCDPRRDTAIWRVGYSLTTTTAGITAVRDVDAPPAPAGAPPWPETGLVTPEAEGLLQLTAALRQ